MSSSPHAIYSYDLMLDVCDWVVGSTRIESLGIAPLCCKGEALVCTGKTGSSRIPCVAWLQGPSVHWEAG